MPHSTQEVHFAHDADLNDSLDWLEQNHADDAVVIDSGPHPDATEELPFTFIRVSFETEQKMLEFYTIYDEMWAYDPFPPGLAE